MNNFTEIGKTEIVACASCAAANEAFALNCRKCGASLTATATIDPLGSIQAEGMMWRKATEGRPKLIVLAVVWLVFLPVLLISAAMAVTVIRDGGELNGFIFFWFSVGSAIVSSIFLFRVTYNFLMIPKRAIEAPVRIRKKLNLKNRSETETEK